jgi:hypothetical protein
MQQAQLQEMHDRLEKKGQQLSELPSGLCSNKTKQGSSKYVEKHFV